MIGGKEKHEATKKQQKKKKLKGKGAPRSKP
jgi:hypothetical protein